MDWLTVEAGLLAASLALVLATVVLAWFTRRLWQETLAARQPMVVASIDFITYNYAELRVVNAGVGAALNADITFGVEGGEERKWQTPVVLPGDGRSFKLLSESDKGSHQIGDHLDEFLTVFSSMKVTGGYLDVAGKDYAINQSLDVAYRWAEAKRAVQLSAYRGPLLPFYQLLNSIKESLVKISKQK